MTKYLLPPALLVIGYYFTDGGYPFWYYVVPPIAWLTIALWWPKSWE